MIVQVFMLSLETQEDGHMNEHLNLLGIKVYFCGENNGVVTEHYDFISADEIHDSYMTMCCLEYFLEQVQINYSVVDIIDCNSV